MIWMIIIVIVVLLILWFISTANKLAKKKLATENAFADLDTYLTKRYDLIPNLVSTIKGYAKHEKETFEGVVNARNKGLNAGTIDEKIDADNEVTQAISKLIALTESYPELKANTNFLDLQETLKKIEDELVGARRYYNAVVNKYNILVSVIPGNIVAKILGDGNLKMYSASEEQRQNVKVEF